MTLAKRSALIIRFHSRIGPAAMFATPYTSVYISLPSTASQRSFSLPPIVYFLGRQELKDSAKMARKRSRSAVKQDSGEIAEKMRYHSNFLIALDFLQISRNATRTFE